MKAVILARVSTEEQKDAGNSLPAQIKRIEDYCERKQFEVAETFSFDESAYKTKRDEFDKILDYLKQTDEKIAVCFDKVDRFSRNIFDRRVAELYEQAKAGKIELHFVSDGQVINSDLSAGQKTHFEMNLVMAGYYSNVISDNVKRAFETKRRKGETMGYCPIGYLNTEDLSGNKTIIPDPKRAHLIIKIFEMYATGLHSLKSIAAEVENLGLRSRKGNPLSPSTIHRILNESYYYGIFYSKKYDSRHPHPYSRLIDRKLFDKCKDVSNKRRKTRSKQPTKDFIFAGLLTCADCGCAISPEEKRKKNGWKRNYYSCTNSKGNCKRQYVNEEVLLQPINELLDRFGTITEKTQQKLVEELRKTSEAEVRFHKAQVARIQKDHNMLTQRKDALLDFYLDEITKPEPSITKQDYDKKLQQLNDRIQQLGIELEEHSKADYDYKTTVGTVLSVARRSKEIFDGSELHEKQQFINFLVQNPKMKDRELVFELRKPFNYVLDLASLKSKTISTSTDRSTWLRGWGSNPRPAD